MTHQGQLDLTFDTARWAKARAMETEGEVNEDPAKLEDAGYQYFRLRMWSASERCRERARYWRGATHDTTL